MITIAVTGKIVTIIYRAYIDNHVLLSGLLYYSYLPYRMMMDK